MTANELTNEQAEVEDFLLDAEDKAWDICETESQVEAMQILFTKLREVLNLPEC